jgi:hypothetical protein
MNSTKEITLLVGDNPFHGISHLSQERGRSRNHGLGLPEHAANLIVTSLENGADGFMFSVSETTLSILEVFRNRTQNEHLHLYAIVPYAYEYIRLAAQSGGAPGLARRFVKELAVSGSLKASLNVLKGIIGADPGSFMNAYLSYEISRIKSSIGNSKDLKSLLFHQVLTDLALALDLDWLFKEFIDFTLNNKIAPGFNTGNFTFLIEKLKEWRIDLQNVVIAAPFNKVGFQMIPTKSKCEEVLKNTPEPRVIAISILAAGYLDPSVAIDYISNLPNIGGVAVGVSKEHHARETFNLLRARF